jgi:phage terminase small subunit
MVTKVDGLTARQTAFAREYANSGNGTQSAIAAGYAVSGAHQEAHRLLKNAEVNKEIQRLQTQAHAETKADQAFVIRRLMHFATNAEVESNAVRATELLGKHLRMFVDVSESTVHHDTQPLQPFTLAELLALREQALSVDANTQDGEFKVLPESKPAED